MSERRMRGEAAARTAWQRNVPDACSLKADRAGSLPPHGADGDLKSLRHIDRVTEHPLDQTCPETGSQAYYETGRDNEALPENRDDPTEIPPAVSGRRARIPFLTPGYLCPEESGPVPGSCHPITKHHFHNAVLKPRTAADAEERPRCASSCRRGLFLSGACPAAAGNPGRQV